MKSKKIKLFSLLILTLTTFLSLSSCQGKKGDKGDKGEDGEDGKNGSDGANGKTAWSNTILPSEGGYVIPSVGSAIDGTEVTFTITPNEGYYLTDFSLSGSSISSDDTSLVYDSTLKEYSYTTTMVENGFVVLASFSNQAKTNYIDGVA